ncbi:hypothetical protein BO71DRAFT_400090 [Aspergillus ellipticus CBS 707.79]|uniref:Uncharacterized protein n=1 Tax=Aspergillus ellipticus CBS 707.79 TaxID=1448320 RepID=A0A319D6F0_9EURO|nr:hypothetical protein BO71DRAFT_400090 [Aspergillus ellipticus CBS 707.79]
MRSSGLRMEGREGRELKGTEGESPGQAVVLVARVTYTHPVSLSVSLSVRSAPLRRCDVDSEGQKDQEGRDKGVSRTEEEIVTSGLGWVNRNRERAGGVDALDALDGGPEGGAKCRRERKYVVGEPGRMEYQLEGAIEPASMYVEPTMYDYQILDTTQWWWATEVSIDRWPGMHRASNNEEDRSAALSAAIFNGPHDHFTCRCPM